MPLELSKAIELVGRLARTRNYPRDESGEGVCNLARGLQKASDSLGIAGGRIIDRCGEISEWCPTDADLLNVAREIKLEDQAAAGTHDRVGHPVPRLDARPKRCPDCEGTGWARVWSLHTHKSGNGYAFVEKTRITEEQAKVLEKQIDWRTQFVYSGVRRCVSCGVPADPTLQSTAPQERKQAQLQQPAQRGFRKVVGDFEG